LEIEDGMERFWGQGSSAAVLRTLHAWFGGKRGPQSANAMVQEGAGVHVVVRGPRTVRIPFVAIWILE